MKSNIHFLKLYLIQFFLGREMFQIKTVEKIKKHILFSVTFFFLENRAVYQIMWKNRVQPGIPQNTLWRLRIHAGYLGLQTHTFGTCNTYCFTTKTMIARTRLNFTLCTLPVLFLSKFICLLSTINSSSFGSILWINLPCEEAFSMLMVIKSRKRRRLTGEHLKHCPHLCLS
jgi:hypothetical protein